MKDYTHSNDPEEIRAEIEGTRQEIGHTVDELQEQMSTETLKEKVREARRNVTRTARHATDQAVDGVNSAGHKTVDFIKENPGPAALIGLGLAWLVANSRRSDEMDLDDFDLNEDHDGRIARVADKARLKASAARESLSHTGDKMSAKLGSATRGMRYRARRAGTKVQYAADEYPMGMVAGCFALGLAVGFALPMTTRERELMGEQREAFLETAQEFGSQLKVATKESLIAAREKAKEELRESHLREDARELAKESADEARRIARAAADEAVTTAESEMSSPR